MICFLETTTLPLCMSSLTMANFWGSPIRWSKLRRGDSSIMLPGKNATNPNPSIDTSAPPLHFLKILPVTGSSLEYISTIRFHPLSLIAFSAETMISPFFGCSSLSRRTSILSPSLSPSSNPKVFSSFTSRIGSCLSPSADK